MAASDVELVRLAHKLASENWMLCMETLEEAVHKDPDLRQALNDRINAIDLCVYLNANKVNFPEIVQFWIDTVPIWCINASKKPGLTMKILLHAKEIQVRTTGYDYSCTYGLFRLVCLLRDRSTARRDMTWLKSVLDLRKAPVKLDITETGYEQAKFLLQCQCVADLKLTNFNKSFFRALHYEPHCQTVSMKWNEKFSYIPAVKNVILDATEAKEFNMMTVNKNMTTATKNLRLLLSLESNTSEAIWNLADFIMLNVKKMTIEVKLDQIKQVHGYSYPYLVAHGVATIFRTVTKVFINAFPKTFDIHVTINWTNLRRAGKKRSVVETLEKAGIKCEVTNNVWKDFRFGIPNNMGCGFEVTLLSPKNIYCEE
uniref:Uncharacterized protein n=1 Tax=Panagrellus redivivus TaxID=6233 RepID=A0A7E4UVU5_PANRE